MTTREEQEQYKLKGMQDGKVEELIKHEETEKRMFQRKNTFKDQTKDRLNEKEGGPLPNGVNQGPFEDIQNKIQGSDNNDSEADLKQTQQDKKKKRKKRKKNKGQGEKQNEGEVDREGIEADPKNLDRFRHNIMASQDL